MYVEIKEALRFFLTLYKRAEKEKRKKKREEPPQREKIKKGEEGIT